jgi:hypothetical protein
VLAKLPRLQNLYKTAQQTYSDVPNSVTASRLQDQTNFVDAAAPS